MAPPPWTQWEALWTQTRDAALKLGAEADPVLVGNPADLAEIGRVEEAIGRSLPTCFRSVVLGFSRKVSSRWQLPEGIDMPEEFDEIFSGEIGWDVGSIVELEHSRCQWIDTCFPDPDDEYDAVWHQKLAFFSAPNGDMLAIDELGAKGSVVYLSHDDGDGHGRQLGVDFADFVSRYSLVGCTGAEDWQWLPFHSGELNAVLDPESEVARRWREWLGVRPTSA